MSAAIDVTLGVAALATAAWLLVYPPHPRPKPEPPPIVEKIEPCVPKPNEVCVPVLTIEPLPKAEVEAQQIEDVKAQVQQIQRRAARLEKLLDERVSK